MSTDRSWMYRRLKGANLLDEFVEGVDEFINFSLSKPDYMDGNKIRCPCKTCGNRHFLIPDDVKFHLYSMVFTSNYRRWIAQGESYSKTQPNSRDSSARTGPSATQDARQPYWDMIFEAFGYGCRPEFESNASAGDSSQQYESDEPPNSQAQEFFDLLKDADAPLSDGCEKQTKLSFVSQMLNIKSEFNLSEACYDRIMSLVSSSLYVKIDVCINNCMLFYKESRHLTSCSVCKNPRYKERKAEKGRQKDIPFKVLRYLPIIPRLQRLYMSSKTAEHMTWHAKTRDTNDISHPSDSLAWKDFDKYYP